MTGGADRLVRRIQRRLLSESRSNELPMREVALLEDRVRRLRAASDRFDHVALSSHVIGAALACARDRVRGERVATEV